MDKTVSDLWTCKRSHGKALFEACERQISEMAGLGTAFPCVPTHFNRCLAPFPANFFYSPSRDLLRDRWETAMALTYGLEKFPQWLSMQTKKYFPLVRGPFKFCAPAATAGAVGTLNTALSPCMWILSTWHYRCDCTFPLHITNRCASVVGCRTCNREVAVSNIGRGYFAPRSTQPSIPPRR